jgi:heparan-alpha-glucosaminide N-acetyltransferase
MTTIAISPEPSQRQEPALLTTPTPKPARITSIDAARGFIMLTMIFVNDFSGVPDSIAPWWMKHIDERVPPLKIQDGLTFVDMVFPGFMFIVGMSIPFAIGSRLKRGEKWFQILPHILVRTLSLLLLGILMVNGEEGPNQTAGLSQTAWINLLFLAAILAFMEIRPRFLKKSDLAAQKTWTIISWSIRILGLAALLLLALIYKTTNGDGESFRLITFSPLDIHVSWFGILGIIGWAYFAGALLYLLFRNNRLPLAISGVLLMGLYVADRTGSLRSFALPGFLAPLGQAINWTFGNLNHYLGNGFNTSGGIVIAGTILATILLTPDTAATKRRISFTLWFITATVLLALVFHKPYLIWKDSGTPAWSLWACAFTATLWLLFYLFGDVLKFTWLTKPFAIAGQNVLFAYLLSEGIVGWMDKLHLADAYGHLGEINLPLAILRSLSMGIFLLALTAFLNWLGIRLKL